LVLDRYCSTVQCYSTHQEKYRIGCEPVGKTVDWRREERRGKREAGGRRVTSLHVSGYEIGGWDQLVACGWEERSKERRGRQVGGE